jgi:hypothetical protein
MLKIELKNANITPAFFVQRLIDSGMSIADANGELDQLIDTNNNPNIHSLTDEETEALVAWNYETTKAPGKRASKVNQLPEHSSKRTVGGLLALPPATY